MIKNRQDLKEYIAADRLRNGIGDNKLIYCIKLICGSEPAHSVRFLRNLRKTEYYLNQSSFFYKLPYLWCLFRHKRMVWRYGIQLQPNVAGKGLRIMHFRGGVILNALSIGEFCGFNTGTLIGNKDSQEARPTIGNHVAFGPGAKAIGKITIGDNCFVAANAVVTKDMPSNSIIAGVPGKVIKHK